MNTDLNSLVNETMSAYHGHEAEKRRLAAERKQQQEQKAEGDLRQLLSEYLLPEFLSGIEFSFRHDYGTYYGRTSHVVYAFFPYENLNWYLSHDGSGNWHILTTGRDTRSGYQKPRASNVTSADLQASLLFEMGKHHEEVERARQEEEDYQRGQECYRRERKEMEARIEADLQASILEADREHERLLPLFKEAEAVASREMWRWPEGTTIELYQVEYTRGGYRDEDGATQIDYAGGWTAAYHLDTLGRIQLEPTRSYPSSTRVIQLVMDIHRPIWTVHQYSRVEELPETLREKVTVSLPGVVKRYFHGLDGKSRLVEVESLDYDEDWHEKTIGEVPLPWIRAIVESAANGE